MFNVLQPALAPDRSREQHDDDAQHCANNLASVAAARKARLHSEQRQYCVKLAANRAIEKSLQFRMNRRLLQENWIFYRLRSFGGR